jgi:caffeoyl-CoA O-methyltransferase
MKSPKQLDHLRNDFIKNFDRIEYNSTPGDAQFLRILIESSRAKSGLEIGVATGYGAIVMGLGFERNKGHLTGIDMDAKMVTAARANIKKMDLQETVTVMKGAALKVIPKLDSSFDFVFIDALKKEYLQYFLAVEPKLKPKAIVVADNVIQHAESMQDFLDFIQTNPKYHSVIIRASDEKQDGMMVISRNAFSQSRQ